MCHNLNSQENKIPVSSAIWFERSWKCILKKYYKFHRYLDASETLLYISCKFYKPKPR